MQKLTLLFAALLMASTTLWAIDNIHCLDANGEEITVDNVNVVVSSDSPVNWGQEEQTTWYVVTGNVTLSKGAVCQGDVRLILGKSLTVKGEDGFAGIQVSGEGNSLTIYQQSGYTGTLTATGGSSAAAIGGSIMNPSCSNITINGGTVRAEGTGYGAGIGGGQGGSGSNITINGGNVTALGGYMGAGIGGGEGGSGSVITISGGTVTANGGTFAAAIGGGNRSYGSNITITGGKVTANGGFNAAGIGSGFNGNGSDNIFMPVSYRIKADGNNPPETAIFHNDDTDLASSLAGKQYVSTYLDEDFEVRTAAMAAINAAVEGITNENILAMAAKGIEDIFQAEGSENITAAKEKALADLQNAIAIYNAGKAEALGTMATPCEGCNAIEVSDEDITVTLYSPKQVKFIKTENNTTDN